MRDVEDLIHQWAERNHGLVDRQTVLEHGMTPRAITTRVDRGQWCPLHPGVYRIGIGPLSWRAQLRAATLAAGPNAVASHRAAAVLWGLDGFDKAPIEITVPMGKGPVPDGTIVHRTRRPFAPAVVDAIPVTSVERTILDNAWSMPSTIVEQQYESALRKRLTTPTRVAECVVEHGGFGVRGVNKILRVLDARRPGRPTGSPAETLLLTRMRQAGIEEPVRQYAVELSDETVAVLDFAWPCLCKGVEIDGLAAHASAQSLEYDLIRQNLLFEAKWALRRYAARSVRRHPEHVVDSIARFLAA
jgi:very-short-patch-repair endonuclease